MEWLQGSWWAWTSEKGRQWGVWRKQEQGLLLRAPPSCLPGPSDPGVLVLTPSTLRSDAGDTPGLWGVPGAGPVRTRVHTAIGGADPQEPGEGASWEGARLLGEHGWPLQPVAESSLMRPLKLLGW